jgi:hypothetical protein
MLQHSRTPEVVLFGEGFDGSEGTYEMQLKGLKRLRGLKMV